MHVGTHFADLFCSDEVCLVFSLVRKPNYYANNSNYVSRGLSLSVFRRGYKVIRDFPAC